MKVYFGNTTKRKNSTLIPAVSIDLGDCLLKSPTSVVSPAFELYSEEYPDYNYCYIPQFHRYYFITDIISMYNGGWEISCLVDVLATYKTAVLNTPAFIERSASLWNPMIPDGALQITDEFHSANITKEFYEMGVMDTVVGSYQIGIAGLNGNGRAGFVSNYTLTESQFKILTNSFFSDALLADIKEYLSNPLDAIAYCRWTPLQRELISDGSGEIYLVNMGLDMFAGYTKKLYSGHLEITIPCPYYTVHPVGNTRTYADYRNLSPYTETELYFPGVGLVEIDVRELLGDGSAEPRIDVLYDISPITGEVVYTIEDINHGRQVIMVLTGDLSVNLPVASSSADYLGVKQAQQSALFSLGVGAAGVAMGVATGSPMIAYGATLGMERGLLSSYQQAQRARQHQTTIHGSVGGWAGQFMNGGIHLYQRVYEVSGTASAIGQPYYDTALLSLCSGYVKCAGAYIGVNATDTELNMLNSMVNGGFYIE